MKRNRKSRRERYERFDDEAYVNEVLYKEGYRPPERKRKKRKGVFLGLLTFFLGIIIIVFAFLLLFHVQKIEIVGMKYSTQSDVVQWLKKDKLASNSLYAWWKYNHTDVKQLPIIESSKISLKAPWSIRVTVKEKGITGYVDYKKKYLCFDKDGTALMETDQKIKGAAYVEGMDINASKVKLGKVLPVSDKNVFKRIVEISQLAVKYKLNPDRITCSGSNLNLYFGKVEVLLGRSNYDERLAQVPPILEKLKGKFPDEEGTLHLENFDISDKAVRFVPKTAQKNDGQKTGQDAQSNQGAQDGRNAQSDQGAQDGQNGQGAQSGQGVQDGQNGQDAQDAQNGQAAQDNQPVQDSQSGQAP